MMMSLKTLKFIHAVMNAVTENKKTLVEKV